MCYIQESVTKTTKRIGVLMNRIFQRPELSLAKDRNWFYCNWYLYLPSKVTISDVGKCNFFIHIISSVISKLQGVHISVSSKAACHGIFIDCFTWNLLESIIKISKAVKLVLVLFSFFFCSFVCCSCAPRVLFDCYLLCMFSCLCCCYSHW